MNYAPNDLYMESSERTVLHDVSMASMSGVLDQLGMLSTYASDVFRGIHSQVKHVSKRSEDISRRLNVLQRKGLQDVKAVFEKTQDIQDFQGKETQMNRKYFLTSNLFTPKTRPDEVMRQFANIAKPPDLVRLDAFHEGDFKQSQMAKYSDPGFFFREWQKAEQARNERELEMKKMRRRKKRREKKERGGAGTDKAVREAQRKVREQQRRQTSSYDEDRAAAAGRGSSSVASSGSLPSTSPDSPAEETFSGRKPSTSASSSRPRPPPPSRRPGRGSRDDEEDEDSPPPVPDAPGRSASVSSRRPRPPVPGRGEPRRARPPIPGRTNSDESDGRSPARRRPPPPSRRGGGGDSSAEEEDRGRPSTPPSSRRRPPVPKSSPDPKPRKPALPDGKCYARDHPMYAKYFRDLAKQLLPPMAIKRSMQQNGLDPSILDDPERVVDREDADGGSGGASRGGKRKGGGGGGDMRAALMAQMGKLAKAPPKQASKAKKTMSLLDQIRNKRNRRLKKVDREAIKRQKQEAEKAERKRKEKESGQQDIADIIKNRRMAIADDSDSDWDDEENEDW
eukprot:g4173.t1